MARIDDYKAARKLARTTLSNDAFETILSRSGFEKIDECTCLVPFIGNAYRVSYPDFVFSHDCVNDPSNPTEVPIQEQVLILHYMKAPAMEKTGQLVAYREIPGASFYYSAFVKRAIDPLSQTFKDDVQRLKQVAETLGGVPIDYGDIAYEFQLFPNIPLQVVLWQGDEEFPTEGNILFDASIEHILPPEDIAWLSGMLVYRMMGLLRGK